MEPPQSPRSPANPALITAIRAAIEAAGGKLTFAHFMELALYHPRYGYYQRAKRGPGRCGDFITSPEVHPFFGFALARQAAACWERLDRPAGFTVREYGAGSGGLAYDILAGLSVEAPALFATIRYELIEPNRHRREEAIAAMSAAGQGLVDKVRAVPPPAPGESLPPIVGMVLANEVADALPVHRLVWRDDALRERFVVWSATHGDFADEIGPLSAEIAARDVPGYLASQGVRLGEGDAIEVCPAAVRWVHDLAAGLASGYALIIDYGYCAKDLYRAHRLAGTLRGHYEHTVTDNPYLSVGERDLTAHVDFTALREAGEAAGLTAVGLTTQADFLAALGMGDFLVEMQR
ncbi:MAG: SAM-dependent methyltransferase, partial [Chloroflexota bacterium]|nr:SAM-dependent methyltransferase [Chloroflexota bacterium]